METDFKEGDRVVGTKPYDGNDSIVGKEGTIVEEYNRMFRVKFDSPIYGNAVSWWCPASVLKKVINSMDLSKIVEEAGDVIVEAHRQKENPLLSVDTGMQYDSVPVGIRGLGGTPKQFKPQLRLRSGRPLTIIPKRIV